jgi:hypothetical protein
MGLTITLKKLRNIRGSQQTSPTNYFPRRRSKLTAISRICMMEMPPHVTGTLPSLMTTPLHVWQRCVSLRVSLRIPLHPHYFIQVLRRVPIFPPGPLMNGTLPRLPRWRKIASVIHSCLLRSLAPKSARLAVSTHLARRNGEYPPPPYHFLAPVQCVSRAGSPAAIRCVKLRAT